MSSTDSSSENHNSIYLVGTCILVIAALITLSLSRFNNGRSLGLYAGSLEEALRARGLMLRTDYPENEEIAVEPLPVYSKYPTGSSSDEPNSRPPSFRSQIVPPLPPDVVVAEGGDPIAAAQPPPPPPTAAVAPAAESPLHAVWSSTTAAEVQAALGTNINRSSIEASR
ncbi:hypothetical protein HDU86_001046 [Geranomyces michiganensis]|nr:hypothetical protein HDU86_001046 [Geranomyces michiganensis]